MNQVEKILQNTEADVFFNDENVFTLYLALELSRESSIDENERTSFSTLINELFTNKPASYSKLLETLYTFDTLQSLDNNIEKVLLYCSSLEYHLRHSNFTGGYFLPIKYDCGSSV